MSNRILQINELLRQELAALVSREIYLRDGLITVTKVKCSPDLKNASVRISVLPENFSGSALRELKNHNTLFAKELKKKLGSVEKEFTDFKSREEPVMAQNESLRRILNSTEQGKIFLALIAAHPNSMTIDDLSNLLDTTAVLIKSSLLSLEELEVVEFNPATREVKLPKE